MDKKIKKILIISVASLIVLRIFSILLIPYLPHLEQFKISNIPHVKQFKYSDHFSAIKEGDDGKYFDTAKMIYGLSFKETVGILGFPLMIVPFIFFWGENYSNVFFPLVIFNSIFLFSLTLTLLVWVSFLIFKKVAPAVFSGVLFLLFPFIFYVFRGYGPQFPTMAWNDINFLNINWLAAMADEPAAFFALLVLFLLLIAERKKIGLVFYSLLGFFAGYSAMIRVSNIVIVLASALVIFIYELNKKFKKLFFYCFFAFFAFLPQLIYNFVFLGSPLSFGYQKEYYTDWFAVGSASGPMWELSNFLHLFQRAIDYSLFAIPAFLILFIIILLGFLYISKINKRDAFIVILWFLLPALFYMFFETGHTAMRYYMPAVGPFVILSIGALGWISEKLKRNCCKPDFPVEKTE